jgi:diadenosine tetraphosphate (Ap4A) HIT family hydrolase
MENCPFCIINKEKTIILEETKFSRAIFSNPALVPCHILIIPKRHLEKISDLTKEELEDMMNLTIKFEEKLLKRFSGCDIRQNFRPFQKQDRFKVNHFHIHLQPREFEDELYKKCQIHEKIIFKDINLEELKKQEALLK